MELKLTRQKSKSFFCILFFAIKEKDVGWRAETRRFQPFNNQRQTGAPPARPYPFSSRIRINSPYASPCPSSQ